MSSHISTLINFKPSIETKRRKSEEELKDGGEGMMVFRESFETCNLIFNFILCEGFNHREMHESYDVWEEGLGRRDQGEGNTGALKPGL